MRCGMPRRPEDGDKAARKPQDAAKLPDQPSGEEEFGGGDFCSPEQQPSTEDDKPLD